MTNHKKAGAFEKSAFVLALALTSALPAAAQTNNSGATGATGTADSAATAPSSITVRRGDDSNWGWLGLLGLAGLGGLLRKREPHNVNVPRASTAASS